ncbi:NAD(P)H-dependent oxidoreductase [Flammeovirga kamogawensis]|uniref:NAD(P)H-dependent oxidoreductase n=1 Tax=Flammeovirga kamogawensis TaxID=373891 RepID=A0ABX8GZM0_9BACT|nr:NAD(P)H-dependent oxidoreductase [Flammeovirga kamogawensis]MBB6459443.1 putative NADPH-quinone reductase [Flammeovirga kamogawensis]QWG08996.1 NAD(P)H-dependent oxidoreductase [Flammeovirga kamogawensis]TRX67287.1 flavodoxin family protein [Flammeovirga kamogawensis]
MKTTIILAHPWHGSFNKAIFDTVITKLEEQKKEYQVIDLNKDNFDPVLREEDLALYSKGETTDKQVIQYQKMLKETNELVFIFPIWWYDVPAILKGFIDKVMLKNFSYVETKTGLEGQLINITSSKVITTSEAPTWYIKFFKGNSIQKVFINATLKGVGIKNVKWLNSPYTTSGKKEKRKSFLKEVALHF